MDWAISAFEAVADVVEIHWLSGVVQELRNLAGDRIVRVKEPK
jgi:hypothetical protein